MTHLFKDYHTSWCGLDASYIPMTQGLGACDCTDCLSGYSTTLTVDQADELAAVQQAQAESARTAEMLAARAEAVAAMSDRAPE